MCVCAYVYCLPVCLPLLLQFYFTLGTDLSSLDERHTLFGQVSEGLDVLDAMNEAPVDVNGRPLQNIR